MYIHIYMLCLFLDMSSWTWWVKKPSVTRTCSQSPVTTGCWSQSHLHADRTHIVSRTGHRFFFPFCILPLHIVVIHLWEAELPFTRCSYSSILFQPASTTSKLFSVCCVFLILWQTGCFPGNRDRLNSTRVDPKLRLLRYSHDCTCVTPWVIELNESSPEYW